MKVCRQLLVVLLLCGTVAPFVLGSGPAGAAEKSPVVIHESVWDAGERDSWSAFTVRVSSERGFRGELRLTSTPPLQPRVLPAPPGSPGAPGRPPGQQAPDQTGPTAPSLRTPLVLEPGVERLVSVMAPVDDTGYRAEVRDESGRLVFAGQARRALARTAYNVGLLTDRRSGDALFQVGSQQALSISRRFRSAVDFPSDPLSLLGLEAIVVADFDSNSLSVEQKQALQDFVALGGSLIIAGGATADRTLSPLPEALVPLRPDAATSTSLAPLVDLVGETTSVETTVTTGELRSGRVAVGAPQGPPLVVEAAYGLGLIVQLTYDPFAVLGAQPAATGALRTLAWSVALLRADTTTRTLPVPTTPGVQVASPPTPEWAVLDQVPGPRSNRGGPAGVLLLVYPLMMGAAAFFLGRERGRSAWRWMAVPGLAVVVSVAMIPVAWGLRASPLTGDEVTIERLGSAASPTAVESFRRLVPSSRGDVGLKLGRGTLAATATPPAKKLAFPSIPPDRVRTGRTTPDEVALDTDTRVELTDLVAWDPRRLHTMALSGPGGWIEAHLRLQAGRVVGTVTNHGDRPVRRMRVQATDGTRAELSADLSPGSTAQVDSPFGPGEPPKDGDDEERLLTVAAKSQPEDLRPGDLALLGILPGRPSALKNVRSNTSLRAVVTLVSLEAADDFVLLRRPDGSGGEVDYGIPRAVCCGTTQRSAGVFELRLPPGMAGPFAIEQTGPPGNPAQSRAVQAAIYDWVGGTWRPLATGGQSQTALAPSEIKDGYVQVRTGAEAASPNLKAVVAKPGA